MWRIIKQLFIGIPIKGEPYLKSTGIHHTTMPPGVKISWEEWYNGKWINNLY